MLTWCNPPPGSDVWMRYNQSKWVVLTNVWSLVDNTQPSLETDKSLLKSHNYSYSYMSNLHQSPGPPDLHPCKADRVEGISSWACTGALDRARFNFSNAVWHVWAIPWSLLSCFDFFVQAKVAWMGADTSHGVLTSNCIGMAKIFLVSHKNWL